jgi:AbiJ N-terminal domain 4
MSDSANQIDQTLTFAQREGAVPLPRQLGLKHLPREVTAPLWGLVYRILDNSRHRGHWLSVTWSTILQDYWVEVELKNSDEFTNYMDKLVPWVKGIVTSDSYIVCLGFLEFCIRHPLTDWAFANAINDILTRSNAAYRIFGTSIAPIASPEEGAAVATALSDVSTGAYPGAKTHLQNAASLLTTGKYADSVRESMNAVESVARGLDKDSTTLAPALAVLEKRGHLHPAMKKGFGNLYGYTSDQQGIRHALLDEGEAAVTETDALYMFGSCAAFVSYLVRSGQG